MKTTKKPKTVFSYLRKRIEWLYQQNRPGTARTYKATLDSLRHFRQRRDLAFSEVDTVLVDNYAEWLTTTGGVTRNTLSFYMRVLRATLNHAADEDLWTPSVAVSHLFRHVYTGVDKTAKRATQPQVLMDLLGLDLSQPRHQGLRLARDVFFFSFYTRGMPFVDVAFLQRSDIANGLISYQRRKTGQLLHVQMEPCIAEIVERYARRRNRSPYVFPLLRSKGTADAYREYREQLSLYNKRLERLRTMLCQQTQADVARLTSYVARHTWATMARDASVPLHIISQCLGHSNQQTTHIYLSDLQQDIVDAANRRVIASICEDA